MIPNYYSNYWHCQKGATVIEYVIIASGVALVVLGAIYAFGGDLGIIFGNLGDATTHS